MRKKSVDKTYLKGVEEYSYKLFKDKNLNCYISLKKILKMEEPFYVEDMCVLNDGHYILEYIPLDAHYTVRTFFDEKKEPFQWYIDISKENGIDENGIPFYDDLYLDIVLHDESIYLVDQNELHEAYNEGKITEEEFNLAYTEARSVIDEIKHKNNIFVNSSKSDLEKLLK